MAGCQTTSGRACDGWSAIKVKRATAEYLIRNDRAAADAVLSHNEFGKKICGWGRR